MLCEECGKREAVYHTTTNINGAIGETHLCAECQSLRGADVFKGIGGLFNMFTGAAEIAEKTVKKRQICPECGTAWDDFVKSGGYVGCEHCYKEFAAALRPVILKTQGELRHTGKAPHPSPEDKRAAEYRRLTDELNKALEAERYEDCARIKRELDRIKNR
ncbi:DNA methylase [Clostridia bacterium]|nr:DNA methylase [Clostridia bacterium]